VTGLLVADDDDIYLPHWFRTQAQALAEADWSRPSLVLQPAGERLKEHDTGGLYHGGWAFRRTAFDQVRGYGPLNNGEDQDLAARLQAAGATQCDPGRFAPPFYIYRMHNSSYHLSHLPSGGYQQLADHGQARARTMHVGWQRPYAELPVERRYVPAPHVTGRDGKLPVELIGPVTAAGRNGPTNGMYALQRALRGRMAEGLDWLTIKSLPASAGALPWFWNWEDRKYAAWWNAAGRPFVQGPNMLFIHSRSPRIDAEECALLDAAHCRAMFCHSPWYRDLISKHRGATNGSPIVLWPYPIDPWPGEPLPDEHDLLIYAKNGHRPGLLEHLAKLFPRHVQIHYGQYQREQLFAAARRSRACAYLADDDHGPLALQEILLAGCPTVGVTTGASLIRHGITGWHIPRLPPGLPQAQSEADRLALTEYLAAIDRVHAFDRRAVRSAAAEDFSTTRIVDTLLNSLDQLRTAP